MGARGAGRRALPARRRGGAIRPVYAKLEELLGLDPDTAESAIIQKSMPRAGVWTTDFLIQSGRKVRPLFTLTFEEGSIATTIVKVDFPKDTALSKKEYQFAILAAAKVQKDNHGPCGTLHDESRFYVFVFFIRTPAMPGNPRNGA